MSHIIKGRILRAFRDREVLLTALSHIGTVLENEKITVALGGSNYNLSRDRYDIVLESQEGHKFRLGFRQENDLFVPYYDEWGRLGTWVKTTMQQVDDRYLAHHYEKQLNAEGFKATVRKMINGALQVEAEELAW